jgi:hypothetical protein
MTTDTLLTDADTGEQQTAAAEGAEGAQTAEVSDATAAAPDTQAAPQGAPEQYEFQTPEGLTLDDAVLGEFSGVAKELNLTQEHAQKVLDRMAPVLQARQTDQLQAASAGWAQAAKADSEFGGDALSENLATAKKALDAFASDGLKALLNESGLGNHPEVIRLFYRTGKAISEDRLVTGSGSTNTNPGDARRLYAASSMNP